MDTIELNTDLADVLASNFDHNGALTWAERDLAVTKLLQHWANKIDMEDLLDYYINGQENYLTSLPDSEIIETIREELDIVEHYTNLKNISK
jgi:hypothetical protein